MKLSILFKMRICNDPAPKGQRYEPSFVEHIANCITHGVAILPSLWACQAMLREACTRVEKLNAMLFGAALLTLFGVSTTYHIVSFIGKPKNLRFFLHLSDRAVIYLFIAASYTPWLTMINVGFFGYHLRWIMWLGAIVGIVYNYCFYEKFKKLEIVLYLTIAIGPSLAVLEVPNMQGAYELAVGGLIYVIGVLFFKCDGVIPFAHAIWHLFVVAGAFIHQYAIQTYLIGPLIYSKMGEIIHNAPCNLA